jgi:hypothetical protein
LEALEDVEDEDDAALEVGGIEEVDEASSSILFPETGGVRMV